MLEENKLNKENLLLMLEKLSTFDKKVYKYDRGNNSKIADFVNRIAIENKRPSYV